MKPTRTITLTLVVVWAFHTLFAGTTDTLSYSSPLLKRRIDYFVVKPAGYNATVKKGERYPVLYVLHCLGGHPSNWLGPGPEDSDIPSLIDAVRFLAVIPYDGTSASWWLDSPVDKNSAYSTWLAGEFKNRIDSRYPTLRDRGNTGITGHSMGGYGAFHNAIRHPDLFGVVFGAKSLVDVLRYAEPNDIYGIGSVLGTESQHPSEWRAADVASNIHTLKGKGTKMRFYSGPNDWFVDENRLLHRRLDSLGITHEYFETDEAHFLVTRDRMREIMHFFDSSFTRDTAVPVKRSSMSAPRPAGSRVPPKHTICSHAAAATRYSLLGRRFSSPGATPPRPWIFPTAAGPGHVFNPVESE